MTHAIQQTSLFTYFNTVKPELGRRQRAVYEEIRKYPNITNTELAAAMMMPINSITPRVKELREKGLVRLGTKRDCKITRERVCAWEVNDNKLF